MDTWGALGSPGIQMVEGFLHHRRVEVVKTKIFAKKPVCSQHCAFPAPHGCDIQKNQTNFVSPIRHDPLYGGVMGSNANFMEINFKPKGINISELSIRIKDGHETFITLRSLDDLLGIESWIHKTRF